MKLRSLGLSLSVPIHYISRSVFCPGTWLWPSTNGVSTFCSTAIMMSAFYKWMNWKSKIFFYWGCLWCMKNSVLIFGAILPIKVSTVTERLETMLNAKNNVPEEVVVSSKSNRFNVTVYHEIRESLTWRQLCQAEKRLVAMRGFITVMSLKSVLSPASWLKVLCRLNQLPIIKLFS